MGNFRPVLQGAGLCGHGAVIDFSQNSFRVCEGVFENGVLVQEIYPRAVYGSPLFGRVGSNENL